MKRISIILLCILTALMSGCKKKTKEAKQTLAEVTITPTITETITQNSPTPEPDSNILTVTPMPTPIVAGKQAYTFQVQPVTIPQNMPIPYMSKEEFPVLDGSTANIPLAEAIYSYLTNASKEEAKNDLHFYKTSGSYEKLLNKESDILFVYEPSQTTLEMLNNEHAQFDYKPLGRDALVFIENKGNPVDNLTRQQIQDIYSGKITSWSEVGGEDMDIMPFQRPAKSGSQSLMEKLAVSSDIIMDGPQVSRPTEMGDLMDELAAYNNQGNALGYSVFFYANYMYSKPELKFVAIDGVMPTNETIQSCEYPYVNDFYVVIRKDEPQQSNARKLYEWMTSVDAQKIVAEAGYVPVVDVSKYANSSKKDYGVIISGSLNLTDHQYMVLHNLSSEEVFLGDSIVDSKFNTVITFPGKYIEIEDKNLICTDQELLVLKSYQQQKDYYDIVYELYSLKDQCYQSVDTYNYLRKSSYGFYIGYHYNDGLDAESMTIHAPNGKIIKYIDDTSETPHVLIARDRMICYDNSNLTICDLNGNELIHKTLPYTNAYLTQNIDWCDQEAGYFWFTVNDAYKVIYDLKGNKVSSDVFLGTYKKDVKVPDSWLTDCIATEDGYLYVTGYVDNRLIVAREDGTILENIKEPGDNIHCNLYGNCYEIIHNDTNESEYHYYVDVIDVSQHEDLVENFDSYIECKEGEFIVKAKRSELTYVVKDSDYTKDSFFYTEEITIPELTQYHITHDGEETFRASFLGIRSFEGYTSVTKVGDYYLIRTWKDDTVYQCLIDTNGNDVYVGKPGEEITEVLLANEIYVFVEDGNYSGVKNLKGEYLYRQLSSRMEDD